MLFLLSVGSKANLKSSVDRDKQQQAITIVKITIIFRYYTDYHFLPPIEPKKITSLKKKQNNSTHLGTGLATTRFRMYYVFRFRRLWFDWLVFCFCRSDHGSPILQRKDSGKNGGFLSKLGFKKSASSRGGRGNAKGLF